MTKMVEVTQEDANNYCRVLTALGMEEEGDPADEIERLQSEVYRLRAERDHARACLDNAVKLLTGIHALLYPAPVTTEDGRTMVFRPKDPDPHEVLQALSDRIRALPDALANLDGPNAELTGLAPREGSK